MGSRARARSRRGLGLVLIALGALALMGGPPGAGAAILYDQTDHAAAATVDATDYTCLGCDGFDDEAADDFVVPPGASWTVGTVSAPGQETASDIVGHFAVSFHSNGAGNLPGATVASRPQSSYVLDSSGVFNISLDPPVTLGPGTYWVSLQGTTFTSPWQWEERTVASGQDAAWRNPGNGYGTGCSFNWGRMDDPSCGAQSAPDLLFRLSSPSHTLTVATAGSGSGAVTSSPPGIDCGSACSHDYDQGTTVTLTAEPSPSSTFAGWSGDCSGTATCQMTMDADHNVSANFTAKPGAPDTKITKVKINRSRATFKFEAIGPASGFQCRLRRDHRMAPFRPCLSPKTYKHLKPGSYKFKVRAFGPGGRDPSAAREKFRIKA